MVLPEKRDFTEEEEERRNVCGKERNQFLNSGGRENFKL